MLLTVDQLALLGELPPGPLKVRGTSLGLPTVQLQHRDRVLGRYPTVLAARAAHDEMSKAGHPGPFLIVH